VVEGDCRELMKALPDGCVDAVITDPPYGLGFMGKDWDTFNPEYLANTRKVESKRRPRNDGRKATGFQNAVYAGLYDQTLEGHRNFQSWCTGWATEALRAAKPGAMLLAFGGTRTFHRLACAIEDAGWEIRDCIMWVYGSGFPKSLDVSKAIDKAAGAEREVVAPPPYTRGQALQSYSETRRVSYDYQPQPITAPATEAAKEWAGWGTALKPAWEPVLLAMKPIEGTFAENVQRYGTGALNIDGCRVGYEDDANPATNPLYRKEAGYKNLNASDARSSSFSLKDGSGERNPNSLGRWPANVIHDGSEEVLAGFPESVSNDPGITHVKAIGYGHAIERRNTGYVGDMGSAARFFYCAKASRSEREAGLEELEEREKKTLNDYTNPSEGRTAAKCGAPARNFHPTVKPLALMEYLIKLVCRPGALVLDPFLGSGTTGMAARKMDCHYLGMDLSEEYCRIARERIALVEAQPSLFEPRAEQLELPR
jgi:site-specific DNA-methyltransferase (adenine-specific)